MDSVLVEGLIVNAIIGVFAWEREVEQVLLADLALSWDNRVPGASDDVTNALDYSVVAERVTQVIRSGRFKLLEAAAEAVAADLQSTLGVKSLTLTLRKPGAVATARSVGVRIQRGLPGLSANHGEA
ncbi:MAG: dihydroneopterin aldolase [Halomonadaceae bacterium]|nr:MAG: dihydroneopterin aldolase [Halomonadaceae bacterium]